MNNTFLAIAILAAASILALAGRSDLPAATPASDVPVVTAASEAPTKASVEVIASEVVTPFDTGFLSAMLFNEKVEQAQQAKQDQKLGKLAHLVSSPVDPDQAAVEGPSYPAPQPRPQPNICTCSEDCSLLKARVDALERRVSSIEAMLTVRSSSGVVQQRATSGSDIVLNPGETLVAVNGVPVQNYSSTVGVTAGNVRVTGVRSRLGTRLRIGQSVRSGQCVGGVCY